jgi:hypothetical protein
MTETEQEKEIRARRQRERRLRQVGIANRYKVLCGCATCGYNAHPSALYFHHLYPEHRKYTVAQRMHGNWARLKAEIRKCVVLCANCHVIVEVELKNANS